MPKVDPKYRYFDWGAFETQQPITPPIPPEPGISALPHYFWAGPASGATAAPAVFRPAVPDDIPFAAILGADNVFTGTDTFTGVRVGTRLVTADYTVTPRDYEITVDATDGNVLLTLPAALQTGQTLRIKRIDGSANGVAVAPSGTDKIDGDSFVLLPTQYQTLTLVDAGVGFWDQGLFIPPFSIPINLALLDGDNVFTGLNTFTGIRLATQTIAEDYNVTPLDYEILVDASSGPVSVFLPDSSGNGQPYRIKKIDSSPNIVTIVAAGSDLIDGSISVNLIDQYSDCSLNAAAPGYWDNAGTAVAPGGLDLPVELAGMRIKVDGSFQLWNPDQSKYFTLQMRGAPGEEYIGFVTPGEA
jgi:hypothetical protein